MTADSHIDKWFLKQSSAECPRFHKRNLPSPYTEKYKNPESCYLKLPTCTVYVSQENRGSDGILLLYT